MKHTTQQRKLCLCATVNSEGNLARQCHGVVARTKPISLQTGEVHMRHTLTALAIHVCFTLVLPTQQMHTTILIGWHKQSPEHRAQPPTCSLTQMLATSWHGLLTLLRSKTIQTLMCTNLHLLPLCALLEPCHCVLLEEVYYFSLVQHGESRMGRNLLFADPLPLWLLVGWKLQSLPDFAWGGQVKWNVIASCAYAHLLSRAMASSAPASSLSVLEWKL